MEQLQQTQYVGSPHSENRQASRMIVLAGTNFYDYDLKAFGKTVFCSKRLGPL